MHRCRRFTHDYKPFTNNLNQYSQVDIGGTPTGFCFDSDGNMTSLGDVTYKYNAENRLVSVEPNSPGNGDTKAEFTYDYMGRRVLRVESVFNGATWDWVSDTTFVYEGWNLIEELRSDAADDETKYYVWGLDLSQSFQGAARGAASIV